MSSQTKRYAEMLPGREFNAIAEANTKVEVVKGDNKSSGGEGH